MSEKTIKYEIDWDDTICVIITAPAKVPEEKLKEWRDLIGEQPKWLMVSEGIKVEFVKKSRLLDPNHP